MLRQVARTIERYGMVSPGQHVGVAVSGGADSVCLLGVLRELGLRLTVLHVNHHLRGEESDGDARFVRELAASLGLPFLERDGDVSATRDNLEQAARRVRQEFFLELLGRGVVDRVAVGHTLSDQAETVLFRFLRGAGVAGLAGVRPVTREGLVRPLIEVRREEVLSFLKERGIPWREDSSNQDRRFARNRIRHDLLPALERDWNPNLSGLLAGTAAIAADEEAYWRQVIDDVTSGKLILRPPAVLLEAGWLAGLDPAVARRVLRRAVSLVKGDLRRVDMRHIEGIVALARDERGSGRCEIPGLDAFRSYDWLRLAPPARERTGYEMPLEAPGRCETPGKRWIFELSLNGYNERDSEQLDWGQVSGGLAVRNWRPGDGYRPVGQASEIRIKSLFERARVPLWDRREWPVITCGERVVWVGGFGPAADAAAAPGHGQALTIREASGAAQFCNLEIARRRLKDVGSAGPRGGGGL
jgi:tRNA(Ile)-lysidine synthase